MIDKEISNLTAIDTLIRQEQPFAVYRIPGEAAPHLLMQATGNVRLLHDLEELDGERGFVIAPFRVSEESPIVLIQPEEPEHFLLPDEYSEEEQEAFRLFQEQETFSETYTEGYETCFRTFIEALRSKRFDKLVLSRKSVIGQFPDFSPSAVFHAACKHYIHSYVYLCYTPRTGVWMGSTPEIILSGEKDEWSTVGLTRKDIVRIMTGIEPAVFGQYQYNPEEFILKSAQLINEQKATAIIEHITYHALDDHYGTEVFTEPTIKGKLNVNAMKAQKHLYDHIVYDSTNEHDFATELDTNNPKSSVLQTGRCNHPY